MPLTAAYGTTVTVDGDRSDEIVIPAEGTIFDVQANPSAPFYYDFSGVISGSGSLTKIGLGELFLSNAANTYTGPTIVTDGTLRFVSFSSDSMNNLVSGSGSRLIVDQSIAIGGGGSGRLRILDGAGASATDSIYIDGQNTGGIVDVLNGSSLSAHNIGVGNGGTGFLNIESGSSVTTTNNFGIGVGAAATGTTVVTGSGSTLSTDGGIIVGREGKGRLEILDGAKATSTTPMNLGELATGVGHATVSGSGSELDTTGFLYVGDSGTGTMDILDGGKATTANVVYLGYNANSSGTMTVSGTGSTFETTGNSSSIYVGRTGSGTLNILDGGSVTGSYTFSIGLSATTGAGVVNVVGKDAQNNASSLHVTNAMILGDNGSGTLNIRDGGQVTVADQIEASRNAAALSQATINVSGTDSLLSGAKKIYIGFNSSASLNVTDGGSVTSVDDFIVGTNSTATGRVIVTDSGSTVHSDKSITVGNNGTGILNVTGGGKVTTSTFFAVGENGHGTVTLSDSQSLLEVGTDLFIGSFGQGTFSQSDGATLNVTNSIYVGHQTTGSGSYTVRDSTTGIGQSLRIGYEGKADVDILDGATVTTATLVDIGNLAGGHGTLNVIGIGSKLEVGTTVENVDKDLYVGDLGTAYLNIRDGGAVVANRDVKIGLYAGSVGTVKVSGTGSFLEVANVVYTGQNSTGYLEISDGGTVQVGLDAGLGINAGGKGYATIKGATSLLDVANNINVGGNTNQVGVLAGTGTAKAANTYVYSYGALSPGDFAGQIGTLTIDGDLTFDAGSLRIDIGEDEFSASISDKHLVTGDLNLGTGNVVVDLTSVHRSGTYEVLEVTGTPTGVQTFIGKLNDEDIAGTRADSAITAAMNGKVLEVTVTQKSNLVLTWDNAGAATDIWNLTDANWTEAFSTDDRFLDGDAVTFDDLNGGDAATTKIITIGNAEGTGRKTVIQILVSGDDTNLELKGDILAEGTKTIGPAGTYRTGKLVKQGNGVLTLTGENEFHGGITMSGGTLVLGNDRALGTYEANTVTAADSRGQVAVSNTTSILIDGTRTISNRFYASNGGSLTFDAVSGETLTISDVCHRTTGPAQVQGGAMYGYQGDIDFIFNVPVILSNNTVEATDLSHAYGGAIHVSGSATPDVIFKEEATIKGNTAVGTAGSSGGGISFYVDTMAGTGLLEFQKAGVIEGNFAQEGGGIYAIAPTGGTIDIRFGDGSRIARNEATDASGGGISATGSNGHIDLQFGKQAVVSDNTSRYRGGGIYLTGGTLLLQFDEDATLSGNDSSESGGAIFASATASGTVAIGDGATISNNRAGGSGGAIGIQSGVGVYLGARTTVSGNVATGIGAVGGAINAGYLSVAGNTLFKDNLARSDGGAIYMNGDLGVDVLAIDTTRGDIAFTGNYTSVTFDGDNNPTNIGSGAVANSIHFEKNTELALSGTGNLYFDDPISAGSTGENSLTKTGTGFVQFVGMNILNPAGTAAGTVAVDAGTFRLAEGAVFAAGSNSPTPNFTLAAGATAAGAGTITAQAGFALSGTISPDNDRFVIPDDLAASTAQTVSDAKKIGTLRFEGDADFDGATFLVDLGASNMSDKTIVLGSVSHTSDSAIELANWQTGSFEILTATDGIDKGKFLLDTTLLTGRREAELDGDAMQLLLHTVDANVALTWTGTVDGVWDAAKTNWSGAGGVDQFIDGDTVTFSGNDTNRNIAVVAGGVRVSDMTIGGSFTFTGGKITGNTTVTGTKIAAPAGKLTIFGATTDITMNNASDFSGGVEINGGKLTLGTGSDLITRSGFYIGNLGTAEVEISGGGQATTTSGITFLNNNSVMTVTGNSSSLSVAGFQVGQSTAGTLKITGGAAVSASGIVYVGWSGGGGGSLLVGAGSTLQASSINVGNTGAGELYGTGTVTGNTVLNATGKISPGDTAGTIGTLTINGNLQLDGGTVLLDVDSTSSYDKIVLGNANNVTFGANKTTISVDQWVAGTFDIVSIASGGAGTAADITDKFNDVVFGTALNDRQSAAIQRSIDLKSLQLVMAADNNLSVSWNTTDGTWDTTSENWLYSGDATIKTFVDGDTVAFAGAGSKTVTLNADRTVSGMTVSGGEYTFSGTGKITGNTTVKGSAIAGPTGQLEIFGVDTIVYMNVETDFENGTWLIDATVVLGHDKALGSLTGRNGMVEIHGNTTLKTEADRLLNNEIIVQNSQSLTIDIASGTTLTFDGTGGTGLAFEFFDQTDLSFAPGSGHLFFQNMSTGAVIVTNGLLDFTNLQSLTATGSGTSSPLSVIFLSSWGELRFGDNVTITDSLTVTGPILAEDGKISFGNNVRILRNCSDGQLGRTWGINAKEIELSGNTLFQDNLVNDDIFGAANGGALTLAYESIPSRSVLTLDATGGDIAFQGNKSSVDFTDPGNPTGGTASSIALRHADMLVTGSGNVYLDDPIKVYNGGGADLGGNLITKTGSGFIQFAGNNVLNPAGVDGGTVSVNAGTFRVVNGASFTTEGNGASFDVGQNAQLAGGGSVTAEQGFTISGTISPDKARFAVPTNLDGSGSTPTIANGDRIGTLTLTGNAVFTGATLQIDLGAGVNDRVDVIGNVSFALDGIRTNTVDIGLWSIGSYTVLSGTTVADIAGLFGNVTVGGSALGSRQSVMLSRNATGTELILTTSGGNNLDLLWTGAASGSWNTTAANWAAGETYNADDYVTFDGNGVNQEVDIAGIVQVSGMKVTGGNYRFNGTGSIVGTAPVSNGQTVTGKLELMTPGTTVVNVATDFVNGTEISAGSVEVGHDAAFGQLGSGNKGHVGILGDTYLHINEDRLLNNRFTVRNGAEWTVAFAPGTTLTLDGSNASDALIVAENGTAGFFGNGYLVLREAGFRAVRGTSFDFTPLAGTTFSRNSTAAQGGAVYVTESLSVSGNTLFTGNTAGGSGGAIFLAGTGLAGTGVSNFVSLDATGGDIVFVNNTAGGVSNSVHMEQNGELRLSGSGNIFFDDPISGGAAGGNSLVKTGTGYVQFVGANTLNLAGTPAGNVSISAGTFRVVNGASFTTQGNNASFSVAENAKLAGGGTVTAGTGFTISGTISPDSARFGTPASVGTDSPSTPETVVADADRIGTLTLNGNAHLDGTTLAVDLDADGTTSDRIDIVGNLSYGANSRVDLGTWNIGVYTILTGSLPDLSHFDSVVTVGGGTLGSRQTATLAAQGNNLVLTTTGGLALDLTWTGASNGLWNTADVNWTGGQTYNADDFVLFDASAVNQTVTVAGNVQVSGMEIRGGHYTFEGAKITGTLPASLGQTVTGRLDLLGGTTRLNLETDFAEGIRLDGGATLVVGQDNAPGTDTGTGNRGTLSVVGNGTLQTETDRTLGNRIFVRYGGNLSVDAASALTLDGTTHGKSAVTVESGAALRFIQGNSTPGSGNLVVQNGTDSAFVNSGTLDFTGLQSLRITGNRTANSGGAVSSTGTLVFSGNTLLSGNTADGSGGAVYASNGSVTLNPAGGDIAFSGNTASGLANSIHLEMNTSLTITGSGNVFFDDPISSGSGGGNSLSKTGAGFVQFTGDNTLNAVGTPAGDVSVINGTFRVVRGATFTAAGLQSTFQLGPGGTLAGGGTISSENGFTISGTISPDADRLAVPGNLDGSAAPTVSAQNAAGTLRLVGNVFLDGAVLAVDLGDSNASDRIEVDGDIDFGTNQNLISLYSWTEGTYGILSASGTIDTIDDRFRVEYLGQTMETAWLQMSGGTMQLVVSRFAPDNFHEWTLETGGTEGDLNPETFPDDVLVHYAGEGVDDVTVTGEVPMAGLIATSGDYHFHAPTKDDTTSKVVIRANPELANQRFNGKLAVLNGVSLEFESEIDAEYGNHVENSTVTMSHDKALGTYSQNLDADENSSGQTTVVGDSEIRIGGEITAVHRTIVTAGSTLHLTGTDDTAVTFTGVRAEGIDGAAFHVAKDATLNISGHTNITGNSTTGTGGGIYLDRAELTLDSSEGGIFVTENIDARGSSDIALDGGDNTISAVGNEAVGGTVLGTIMAAPNSTGNKLIVDTDSFVQLSGNSLLNNSSAFSPFGLMRMTSLLNTWTENEAVTVTNGAWRVTESGTFDAGDDTLISVHSTGTIASGGTVKATQFDIAGNLAPDTAVFRPSSKVIRSELQTGILTLDGKVRLSGAELTTDLKRNNVSDKVVTTGLVTFGDENVVNVNAWQKGTFIVLESLDGFTEDVAANRFGAVLFGGEQLVAGGRLSASLTTVGDTLVLETAVSNRMNLRWTGGDENGLLNMASTGNWVDENGAAARFAPTDFLYFDADGRQGTITLGNADGTTGGRTVSGVVFSGGEYVLEGGDLFGIKTAADDGNLIVADGTVGFRNNIFFEGGIYLQGTSNITLEGRNALHAEEEFFLAETASLTFQPGDDLIRGESVTLDGTVTLTGEPIPTTRRSPRYFDMIVSTGAALDADRLHDIFDYTVGLLNRTAVIAEDGSAMDLLYTATPLDVYARDSEFTGNETAYADYFRDTFNLWEMEDFEEELMKLNDARLKEFFGELAGAALLADTKTMALSNPYRVVARHFIEESDTNRMRSGIIRSSGRNGSTNNFWFVTQQREIEQDGDGNANAYRISRTGIYLGGDRRISTRLLAGFLFGYGNPKQYRRSDRIEMDDLTFAGYAKYRTDSDWDLNGFVGYGSQEYESRRMILGEKAEGKFDGDSFFATLEAVRNVRMSGHFTLLPTLGVDYGKAWADGFTENGARFSQYFEKSETDQVILRFGLNTRWLPSYRTRFDTRLQYGRRLDGNDESTIRTGLTASSAAPTTLRGVAIGRDIFNVGVGGHVMLGQTGQSRIYGNYDFDRGNRSKAHTAELGFQHAW